MYLASGVRDRKFAGFFIATTTAPDSITTTYYDQGDSVQTSLGEQSDGYAQISHPFRKDIYDLSYNLKQRTYSRWDAYPHGNGTFVGLGQQLTEDFASDGSHRDKATAYQYSSTTDDVVRVTQYGEVTGNTDGTFTDITGDIRTANMVYAASSSINMNLPVEKTLLDNNGATSSDRKLYYDALSFGQVGLGNNTRQEEWIFGTTYASSTNTFTSYGLVATSTDRRGNATSYVYDANNLFQATTTNALGQKVQNLYDYSTGKTTQTVDQNNATTTTTYDGLGRPLTISEPDPSNGSLVTKTTYTYTDSNTPGSTSVQQTDYLNSATSTNTYTYVDGLGRNLQQRTQAEGISTYAVKDWTYNNLGLLNSESLLYLASSTARSAATSTSALFTTYTYDALDRVLTSINAVSTTTNAYNAWTITTTDGNGKIKD
jgi:YD repeat-containing protein